MPTRLPARTQFQIAALATLAGVVAVAAYGWNALETVSDDADRLKAHLARMKVIERVEEELHELSARSPKADVAELERDLAQFRQLPHARGELPILVELDERVARAKVLDTPIAWSRAAETVSQITSLAVVTATDTLEDAADPVASSARRIVRLGAGIILVCGALSALAFLRLRRERRDAEAQLRASDRLGALGTMAASVAHELNNPLATISGCATAVRDRLAKQPESHADSLEYLGMIVDETRRCSGIVRSLRDLARDTPPAMCPSDLTALAREVVALVEMSREGPSAAIEVSGDAAVEIVCDPDKLKQLLLNLLVNARDACAESGHIRVSVVRTEDGGARVAVEDDGSGIDRAALARVFEPFHTGKTRGLGLGLFVCDRIAQLHGGKIAVTSDGPGRGSRFVVDLPPQPPSLAAADPAAPRPGLA